jgi:hypothetical protein
VGSRLILVLFKGNDMSIGLIPISEGFTLSHPDLDKALKDLAFCVLGSFGRDSAPDFICKRVHDLMLLPKNYTVIGCGIDYPRRQFYISVDSPEIPSLPEGWKVPSVLVVYETQTWSTEKNQYVPCPLRLCSITINQEVDHDPWTMPVFLDGYTPESLQSYMKVHHNASLKEILKGVVRDHPEFFDDLPENNNACADCIKDRVINDYFEIRWRRNNGILW